MAKLVALSLFEIRLWLRTTGFWLTGLAIHLYAFPPWSFAYLHTSHAFSERILGQGLLIGGLLILFTSAAVMLRDQSERTEELLEAIPATNAEIFFARWLSAVNLSACLSSEHNLRTLLVDLDAQGHAGTALGIEITDSIATTYEAITGRRDPFPASYNERLHIWPGARDIDDLDTEYINKPSGHHLLKEALEKVWEQYDIVVIDTPPNLHLSTLNALTAATHFLVPISPGFLSIDGMSQLLRAIAEVRQYTNPNLEMIGVVLTQADSRTRLPEDTIATIKDVFTELRVLDTVIPSAIALAEAPGFGKSIFEYRPKSKEADAYRQLTEEVLNIVEATHTKSEVS